MYTQDFERLATLRLQYLGPANRFRTVAVWDLLFLCERNVSEEYAQYHVSLPAGKQLFLDKGHSEALLIPCK